MKNTHTLAVLESTTNWSFAGSVPQFNPALGTLTEVLLTLSVGGNSRFRVESRETQPTQASVASQITASATAGSTPLQCQIGFQHTQALEAADGAIDYAGPSGFNVLKSGSGSADALAPSLSAFIGVGTVPVTVTATASATCEGLGDYRFVVNSRAAATIAVEYTFTPNP